jgi:hypothetical protein
VWDQAEKLEQVRSAMETRLLSWVLEFTYPNDWLAFLVCSYPIDHYSGRKLSLDGVVPAIHPTVMVQPASTTGKPTRRDEQAGAANVPGTATHAAEEARLKRARLNDEAGGGGTGGGAAVTITMNHNINKHGRCSVSDPGFVSDSDDTIAGLRSQMDTTKELISDLQELGAEEYSYEIKSYKQSIIQLLQEILQLQKEKNLSMKQHKVSILQASNSIVQNATQSTLCRLLHCVNHLCSPLRPLFLYRMMTFVSGSRSRKLRGKLVTRFSIAKWKRSGDRAMTILKCRKCIYSIFEIML